MKDWDDHRTKDAEGAPEREPVREAKRERGDAGATPDEQRLPRLSDEEAQQLRCDRVGVGERVEASQLRAIDRQPGSFHVERDASGRTACIEGWLDRGASEWARDATEKGSQRKVRTEAGPHPTLGRLDASHLIPYAEGGRGRENLVVAPERVNRSFLGALDREIGRQHSAAGASGESVYVRCTVTWGDDAHAPVRVRHELFRGTREGESVVKVTDVSNRIDWKPEQTEAQILRTNLEQAGGQDTDEWISTQRPEVRNPH